MRRILATTDFSSRSERALRRAGLLARQFKAELTIAHVVEEDQPESRIESQKREAEEFLAEQARSMQDVRDIDYRILVTGGDAFDGILRVAETSSADLIVMGAHRKQLLRDVFIGTTIERVIRLGSRPVLMVNQEATHPYRRTLAAIDMSESSAHALHTGMSLGLLDNVDVMIVHAFVPVARTTLYASGLKQSDVDKYVTAETDRKRAELRAFLETRGLTNKAWSYQLGDGDPYEVVSGAARRSRAELIVIGTHGRSGLSKLLLGSVAEQLLYRLEIDILAVPPPRDG